MAGLTRVLSFSWSFPATPGASDDSVHSGAVIHPLKREELVDRRYGVRIFRRDQDLTAARKVPRTVTDFGAQLSHFAGARHVCHRVHESRQREITTGESGRGGAHVGPDGRFAGEVGLLSLQHDTATTWERLEDMLRCVLVDSHRGFATLLQRRK